MKLHVAALAVIAVVCVLATGSEAVPKMASDDAVAKPQLFPDSFWEGYKEVSSQVKKLMAELKDSKIGDHARSMYADMVTVISPHMVKIRENVAKMYQAYVDAKAH